ncbi:hypothetical protein TNCT_381561 [Trichonephila clavata]|uniref:Uncharacterized protein n=1 Tax=Trichonephila clavata TaxID=2740835 RepID=A0A8X6FB26_TRICU|nr:hypothetical protein TNCT_381561 [Trichonephila clavata]
MSRVISWTLSPSLKWWKDGQVRLMRNTPKSLAQEILDLQVSFTIESESRGENQEIFPPLLSSQSGVLGLGWAGDGLHVFHSRSNKFSSSPGCSFRVSSVDHWRISAQPLKSTVVRFTGIADGGVVQFSLLLCLLSGYPSHLKQWGWY